MEANTCTADAHALTQYVRLSTDLRPCSRLASSSFRRRSFPQTHGCAVLIQAATGRLRRIHKAQLAPWRRRISLSFGIRSITLHTRSAEHKACTAEGDVSAKVAFQPLFNMHANDPSLHAGQEQHA